MKSLLGGVKTQLGQTKCCINRPYPPLPLSHDSCMVRTALPLSLAGMVGLFKPSSEQGFVSTHNRCHMDL